MKNDTLTDKTILITGASGGIGVVVADMLLERGLRKVALHYHDHEGSLLPLLKKYDLPPDQFCFGADLTDESQVRQLRDAVTKRYGAVFGLINLAGITVNGMTWKTTHEDFMRVVNASLTSTFLCAREFMPAMRDGQSGRIINTSSVVASTGMPGAASYCAAKAGVEGLTRAMAMELANKKITVNALALGYFDHGMIKAVPENIKQGIVSRIPVGRLGHAKEIFGALSYLLSDEGAYVTGQVFHINGGLYS